MKRQWRASSFLPLVIIFLVLFSGIIGVVFYRAYRTSKIERLCDDRLTFTWSAGKSYSMDNGLGRNVTIDPRLIYNMNENSNATCYLPPGVPPECPLNGARYVSFKMSAGPICPNGHTIEKKKYRRLVLYCRGPKDKSDLLSAISDEDPVVRRDVIPWLMRADYISDETRRECLTKLQDDNDKKVKKAAKDALNYLQSLSTPKAGNAEVSGNR